MGLVFSSGNSGGIVSSFAYWESPRFPQGHGTALGFAFMLVVTAIILTIWCRRENRRRDVKYGPPPTSLQVQEYEDEEQNRAWGLGGMSREEIIALGDNHPAFRYIP